MGYESVEREVFPHGHPIDVNSPIKVICIQCGRQVLRRGAKFCSAACQRKRYFAKMGILGTGLPTGTTGAISELVICCDLLRRGYEVFRSVSPSCSCDLAVLKDGKLLRIEVKSVHLNRLNGKVMQPARHEHCVSGQPIILRDEEPSIAPTVRAADAGERYHLSHPRLLAFRKQKQKQYRKVRHLRQGRRERWQPDYLRTGVAVRTERKAKDRGVGHTAKLTAQQVLLGIHLRELGLAIEYEYRFLPDRKFRFDVYVPELRLGIEVDGGMWRGGHRRSDAIEVDNEKVNLALKHGFACLRFTNRQVDSGYAKQFVKDFRASQEAFALGVCLQALKLAGRNASRSDPET